MRRHAYRASAALLLATFLTAAAFMPGCGEKEPTVKADRPNVVLILLDALRKDHLGAYGYKRDTSPVMDRLAADGLVFDGAISQATYTYASMYSMFTSKYPSQLSRSGAESILDEDGGALHKLSDKAVTLAEALRDSGYNTGCISGNRLISEDFGTFQGFEMTYLDSEHQKYNSDKVVDVAIDMFEDGLFPTASDPRPFFLHMHMMEVHAPNNPPEPYFSMLPARDGKPHEERHFLWEYGDGEGLDTPEFEAYKDHKTALYDASIRYADAQIGRLMDYLRERGQFDNTVIIIAADHGEELWDHAEFEKEHLSPFLDKTHRIGIQHGLTLFGEAIEVPLIMHGPGIPRERVEGWVRNVDIMPSILGLAGVDYSGLGLAGVDLVRIVKSGEPVRLVAMSENLSADGRKRAILEGRYKYVRFVDREFLFDKEADPGETVDVSAAHPDVMERMRTLARGYDKALLYGDGEEVKLDDKAVKELKALGYLQ